MTNDVVPMSMARLSPATFDVNLFISLSSHEDPDPMIDQKLNNAFKSAVKIVSVSITF